MPEKQYGYLQFLRLVFHTYPKRAILGATLMITQSFLYNAIFFTYALVLTKFYGVSATSVPVYGLAFSVGNLLGPLVLGPLFDSVGRKKMISGTYILSGVLLAVSAFLFDAGSLNATTQTLVWVVIFFFASAGASAAYLTVSETWPIEIRSEAIAVFFAIGCIAGALGPAFYGALIGDGSSRTGLFIGYLVGAGIMIIGGVVELLIGINAEGKSLEDITKPLTAADAPTGGGVITTTRIGGRGPLPGPAGGARRCRRPAATFLPDLGMTGVSLRCGGREHLALPGGLAALRAGATLGIPLLAPWANRLAARRYRAAGVDVDLDGLPLGTDGNGLPIHGFLVGRPGWRVGRRTTRAGRAGFRAEHRRRRRRRSRSRTASRWPSPPATAS